MITDRTSATEAEFAARLAPIEAAPHAEESSPVVAAMLALAEELEDVARDYRHAQSGSHDAGARNAHMAIARRIRAALAAALRPDAAAPEVQR